jgi:hypothetical protein
MTDATLRDHLDRLVGDEPALGLDLPAIVGEGRRLRRHRRLLVAASGAAGAAAIVAAVAVPLALQRSDSPDRLLLAKPLPAAAAPTTEQSLTPAQQRIADAIRTASPADWTFELGADRWDGATDVEGTADDGAGAGRLTVGLSTEAGAQQVHPCRDPEFKAGVGCHEQTLADGSVLSVRDVVDYKGIEYTDVALTHPDGTGVIAEAGNFVIPWPLPSVITPEQKRHLLEVSRHAPTYSPQALAKVVLAVDAVTS